MRERLMELSKCALALRRPPGIPLEFCKGEPDNLAERSKIERAARRKEERDKEKMKAQWAKAHAAAASTGLLDGPQGETCSCVDGMPCMDPYVCLDWYNRVAVAQKHGFNPTANKIWKL